MTTALKNDNQTLRGRLAQTTVGPWRYVPIAAVALVALAITVYTFHTVRDWETQRVQRAFSEAAQDRVLLIGREMENTLGVVQDLVGLFEASPALGRREFRKFVGPTLERHAYIDLLEWVPRVSGADRDDFIAMARRSFRPYRITERDADGSLVDAEERDEHFPVLYVQPYQQHKDRLGYDLASEAPMLRELEVAGDTGTMHVSSPVRLEHEHTGDGAWGFVVSAPVYSRPSITGTLDDSEIEETQPGELRGFAIGIFRIGELVERALENLTPAGITIHLYEDRPGSVGSHLYTHLSRLRRDPRQAESMGESQAYEPALVHEYPLSVADRQWQVVTEALPGYFQPARWTGIMVMIGGLAFTGLLVIYLVSLVSRAQEVQQLVEKRTAQLMDAVTALNQEVSDRRNAERQLQALNDTLELRVEARTVEAERRAKELEQFAYVTSHDLKAPLRAIGNLADWIEEDLQETLDEALREHLHLLKDRVRRMHGLIEGLLEYSRVGQVEGSITLVDSAQLLAEIIDSLSPPEGFAVHVSPDMPTFNTDRLKLHQVFANLISNGLKHHHGASGNIWVDVAEKGRFYEFSVRDDGPGIAPEYHDKVFMMFQTLETKDSETNTGIGLALVRKIVQENGGSIILESKPGEGARFRFTWPREPSA